MNSITFNDLLMLAISIISISAVALLAYITVAWDSATNEDINKDIERNLKGAK